MTTPINRRLQSVPAGHIDFTDNTFRLRPVPCHEPLPARLAASLERVGIMLPPLLKETAPHRYQVVEGWRRLQGAFVLLDMKQCPCWILPIDTPDEVVLTHQLEAILVSRLPSPVERGFFLRQLLKSLDREKAAARFLPLFGLAPQPQLIAKSLRILELEEPLLIALDNGQLVEEAAEELLGLSFPDRFALFDLIEFLNLDAGNQKYLVRTCRELASRAGRPVIDVLDRPALKAIIHHQEADETEKTVQLLAQLHKLRFPDCATEQELAELAAQLDLPDGVSLTQGAAADRHELALTISFRAPHQLAAIWPQLKKALAAAPTVNRR